MIFPFLDVAAFWVGAVFALGWYTLSGRGLLFVMFVGAIALLYTTLRFL